MADVDEPEDQKATQETEQDWYIDLGESQVLDKSFAMF